VTKYMDGHDSLVRVGAPDILYYFIIIITITKDEKGTNNTFRKSNFLTQVNMKTYYKNRNGGPTKHHLQSPALWASQWSWKKIISKNSKGNL